jgi:hypothetical protein
MAEIEITVSDGDSTFRVRAYAGHETLKETIEALDVFKDQVHGGIYDLRLGGSGPEFAGGAFHARLHFAESGRGRLFITATVESPWFDFAVTRAANRCVLHLVSEPALLDKFIVELTGLAACTTDEAFLSLPLAGV